MSAEAGPSKIVDHLPVNPIPEGDVEMTRQDIEDLQDVVHELKMKWSGKSYSVDIAETDTVGDLKALLYTLTTVPPVRQKIIGLVKGKIPSDEVPISTLSLGAKAGKDFTMIGTPEGDEFKAPIDVPDVLNDLDVDYKKSALLALEASSDKRNRRKLLEAVNKLEINVMNPPRPGKKLLVLDLDYTLLDCKAYSENSLSAVGKHYAGTEGLGSDDPKDYARPGLHAFLTAVYPYYDIVIWSQTAWRWLESKLIELEMVGGVNESHYNISFVLDKTPMFSVYSQRNGQPFKHEVKALEIIWKKFPGVWSKKDSIHIDDLSRNFAMNPQNGLKISAFKHALRNKHDRELYYLSRYLLQIAQLDDISLLDHGKWKQYMGPLPEDVTDPVVEAGLPSTPK